MQELGRVVLLRTREAELEELGERLLVEVTLAETFSDPGLEQCPRRWLVVAERDFEVAVSGASNWAKVGENGVDKLRGVAHHFIPVLSVVLLRTEDP